MNIKRTIKFDLRQYGKQLYQIRIRASYLGQRLEIRSGCQISNPAFWDYTYQLVTPDYVGAKGETAISINNLLRAERDHIETAFKFFEVNGKIPTVDELRDKYLELLNGTVPKKPEVMKTEKEPDLFKTFDMFVRECGEKNAWTEATFEKMAALKEDLKNFKKNLKFSDLTESTLTNFVVYLRDDKVLRRPRKAKGDRLDYDLDDITGLKNTTIGKKLGYLRWFLNWATSKGYNKNIDYKTFKPTLKQTQKKVIYLTQDEIMILSSMEFDDANKYLEPVRDVFLFCCFTGLRYSDACNLRRTDIKDDHLEVTTVKTDDSIIIELNDVSKMILDRYKDIIFPGNRALPTLANQNFNRNLKALCKLAGFTEKIRITTYKGNERKDELKEKWELIGSHCGRRTFIVNALSLGIAPSVVMAWSGHASYSSMRPYIDIVDSIKVQEMKKFNSIICKSDE